MADKIFPRDVEQLCEVDNSLFGLAITRVVSLFPICIIPNKLSAVCGRFYVCQSESFQVKLDVIWSSSDTN